MTSHDVVSFVRHILHMKKVGHAGTLDPGAAGVLPVAVGTATRLLEYLELSGKSYRAEMLLGVATDSGDDTGEVIASRTDFIMPDREKIEAVLENFRGNIRQVPPAHSAIKIAGRRACDMARAGENVDMPVREVCISKLELLSIGQNSLLLDIDCSKGTYIRSLCADIGEALGIPATMSFLVRRRVGAFTLPDTVSLEELAEYGSKVLLRPELFLGHLPRYDLRRGRRKAFCNGLATIERNLAEDAEDLRVYAEGEFLGIGSYDVAKQVVNARKVIVQ